MKHFWFGTGLLALLLAVSLLLGGSLDSIHHSSAKDLEKAAEAARQEDWPLATALCLRAEKHWQKRRDLTAVLARHDLIDQVDAGFAALEAYVHCRETASFAAACAQLAQQVRNLHQPHSFHWWNLL